MPQTATNPSEEKEHPVPTFTVNYHANPIVGGMGHISISAKRGDKTAHLSVHPKHHGLTPLQTALHALSYSSFYAIPTGASNPTISHDTPVTAAYEIPPGMLTNPEAAFKKIQEISHDIRAGDSAYTIMPGPVTSSLYGMFSKKVRFTNVQTGIKTFDRELIASEVDKVKTVNCASSLASVMEAGGVQVPPGIGPFQTPSAINRFFKSRITPTTPHHAVTHAMRAATKEEDPIAKVSRMSPM